MGGAGLEGRVLGGAQNLHGKVEGRGRRELLA